MKIMIFTEGTIIMHASGSGKTRQQRISQVLQKEKGIKDFRSYIPIGNAAIKISEWTSQGAVIIYLTSRRKTQEAKMIKGVLQKHRFPEGVLEYRKKRERYKDVAERIMPDILIEDDCESIGGKKEMTYTFIQNDLKNKIISIPIPEFGGIDYLPSNINDLK